MHKPRPHLQEAYIMYRFVFCSWGSHQVWETVSVTVHPKVKMMGQLYVVTCVTLLLCHLIAKPVQIVPTQRAPCLTITWYIHMVLQLRSTCTYLWLICTEDTCRRSGFCRYWPEESETTVAAGKQRPSCIKCCHVLIVYGIVSIRNASPTHYLPVRGLFIVLCATHKRIEQQQERTQKLPG